MTRDLPDPAATETLGRQVARALQAGDGGGVITLSGPLGAGKTALARALIGALGHEGPVVSPSYTLVEPYAVAGRTLYHLDLYRLGDPEELEFIGVRELSPVDDWLVIEWADRGTGFLPAADLDVALAYRDAGRTAALSARSPRGRVWIDRIRGEVG